MKKFFVLFCIPAQAMTDWMTKVPEAERKTQMDQMMADWKTWADAHKDAIVDNGGPLGKTKRVTKDGVTDVKNDLNYYMIIQADSHEAAAELIKDNPHVQMIPSAYVEVMDATPRGM